MGVNMSKYKKIDLDDLLSKCGKSFFVKHFYEIKSGDLRYDDLLNDYTENSARTRISKARKIFNNRLQIEALKKCINSVIKEEDKKKATEILNEETNNVPEKKIMLYKNVITNFNNLEDEELIQLYSDTIYELKQREIIRSMKVTGDLGEYYAETNYNLNEERTNITLVKNKSQKDFDALDENERKYQIKTLTTTDTGDFSNITSANDNKFDYLVICKLDTNYNLENIFQLSWDLFWKHKIPRKGKGKYKISLNKALLKDVIIIK